MAVSPQKSRELVGKVGQAVWNGRPALKQCGMWRGGGRFKRKAASITSESPSIRMRIRKVGVRKLSTCLALTSSENS